MKTFHKCFSLIVYSLLIIVLFGSVAELSFAATEEHTLAGKVSAYMTAHEDSTAGVATVIIKNDEIIYKAKGFADLEQQTPVDEETVFEWGSVSKILIWVSVMQLVEADKLKLDREIEAYLPNDFHLNTTFDESITLRHLMHHSAGFDDRYTDLMVERSTQIPSLKEVLEAADHKQVFAPGQVVAYSNYGASLAAYIVEEVSGLDYREYVRKHIFEPLHMTKTAIDAKQSDHPWVKEQRSKVQGYTEGFRLIQPNHYVIPMYPAGSVVGTASDLQKLMQALLAEDGAPLFEDRTTLNNMFEPTLYYPKTNIPRMANGLFYLPSENEHVYGHGGNTIAFSSSFYVDRKDRTGVVVLTNMANESTFTLGIPDIVFGEYTYVGKDPTKLENSANWNGFYEPARVPHRGFSKIYKLFLRGKVKQADSYHLTTNGSYYSQVEPGIYITKDVFSAYALDVYSESPQMKKMLSSAQTDLLYVPFYRHFFEWSGLAVAGFSILFSAGFLIISIANMIRRKKRPSKLFASQHGLNLLMFMNVIWISYETLSMTTYASLKPFLTANIVYIVCSLVISGCLLIQMKRKQTYKYETIMKMVTIMSTIILCTNLIYWEFYY